MFLELIEADPDRLPSIDDLLPLLVEISKGYAGHDDPFTAPRYRVGLIKRNGEWLLAWGDEYENVPGNTCILRMGLFGNRLAPTALDLIDNYRGT
jgi:hypothetical protein